MLFSCLKQGVDLHYYTGDAWMCTKINSFSLRNVTVLTAEITTSPSTSSMPYCLVHSINALLSPMFHGGIVARCIHPFSRGVLVVTYIVRLVIRCFMTSYQVCFSGDLYCPFGHPMLYDFVSSVL